MWAEVGRCARKWERRGEGGEEHESGGMVVGSGRQMATGKKIPETLTRGVPANKTVFPPPGGCY